jgi:hypothetical protein
LWGQIVSLIAFEFIFLCMQHAFRVALDNSKLRQVLDDCTDQEEEEQQEHPKLERIAH